jgi:hypothetical protein
MNQKINMAIPNLVRTLRKTGLRPTEPLYDPVQPPFTFVSKMGSKIIVERKTARLHLMPNDYYTLKAFRDITE